MRQAAGVARGLGDLRPPGLGEEPRRASPTQPSSTESRRRTSAIVRLGSARRSAAARSPALPPHSRRTASSGKHRQPEPLGGEPRQSVARLAARRSSRARARPHRAGGKHLVRPGNARRRAAAAAPARSRRPAAPRRRRASAVDPAPRCRRAGTGPRSSGTATSVRPPSTGSATTAASSVPPAAPPRAAARSAPRARRGRASGRAPAAGRQRRRQADTGATVGITPSRSRPPRPRLQRADLLDLVDLVEDRAAHGAARRARPASPPPRGCRARRAERRAPPRARGSAPTAPAGSC